METWTTVVGIWRGWK